MKFLKPMCAGATMLLAAACGGGPPGGPLSADGDIRTAQALRASSPFNDALRQEYVALAQGGARQFDYIDAGIFARKAVLAGNNQTVLPFTTSDFAVPASAQAELTQARADLISVLDSNARTSTPPVAARAQAMYDCWLEKSESVYWIIHNLDCRAEFMKAMETLRGRPMATPAPAPAVAEPPARDFLVFFDFDRSNIRPDAQSVLARVISSIRSLGTRAVSVIGHADKAGAGPYNQRLSERRAQAVAAYLRQQGVPSAAIQAAGRGENDPRVNTPDGVREQENRRVEIRLQ